MPFYKVGPSLAAIPLTDTFSYYECACYSDEHTIKAYIDGDDYRVHLIVGLNADNFFKRLVTGIKFILGYESKYGHYYDFIFQPESAKSLIKVLETSVSIQETVHGG